MHQKREMILNCRNDVINGKKILEPIISELFNINNEFLLDLSDAANHITRHFHGSKVDIEELANIKKNFCSEDCTFCSQSAFFNTKITGYELPPPEEIVKQALNAKNDGAGSFCLVIEFAASVNIVINLSSTLNNLDASNFVIFLLLITSFLHFKINFWIIFNGYFI